MASCRPPGSILEAPGLHFGGSGPHFRRLWTSYLEPRTPRTAKNLQKQKLHHKVARPPKGGWAAVTPPGGFNPPATEGVPTACQTDFQLGCPITAGQSRHSFEQFVEQFDLKCSFPYPFLSPGAWGPPQTRRQKAEKFGFFAFLVDFFAFRTALEK